MKGYDVRPGHGVGPLIHGMTRDEVEQALGQPERRSAEDFDDSAGTEIWEFDEAGLHAWFEEEDDWRLGTIMVFQPDAVVSGVRFVDLSESELAAAASEAGLGAIEVQDDFEELGRDYQCDEQCISFWVRDGVVENLTATPRFADDDDTILWPEREA